LEPKFIFYYNTLYVIFLQHAPPQTRDRVDIFLEKTDILHVLVILLFGRIQ